MLKLLIHVKSLYAPPEFILYLLDKQLEYLAVLTSCFCFILIVLRIIYPQILIDTTTIALIIIMIFPWLIPHIKTIKFPGGTEVDFKEEVERMEYLSQRLKIPKTTIKTYEARPTPESTYLDLFKTDPNLALAFLRINIERKLREVAKQKELDHEYGLREILHKLHSRKIVGSPEYEILNIIIDVCNRAVHAEKVDALTALKVLDLGTWMLSYLDSLQ
jgi:hypothetical protein